MFISVKQKMIYATHLPFLLFMTTITIKMQISFPLYNLWEARCLSKVAHSKVGLWYGLSYASCTDALCFQYLTSQTGAVSYSNNKTSRMFIAQVNTLQLLKYTTSRCS